MFPMNPSVRRLCWLSAVAILCIGAFIAPPATAAAPADIYAQTNLVAWCIVPFDAKKRGPEERAQMLDRLGIKLFAYDYRAEHIPTFDTEVETMQKHGIEIMAWWFPGSLNDEAKGILNVIERHKIKPQLWITGGGTPMKTEEEQKQRVQSEAKRIRPIAEAAAKLGCKVALYNHGNWFGEPENQLAIIKELNLPNVGLVYNFHHGHDHIARFPELLKQMKPHLLVVNINGMIKDGEKAGKKILPVGEGTEEAAMLKTLRDSGWQGPVGILNHRPEMDAEVALKGNLDGLQKLRAAMK
jgi:sugar phosphate isomerase/epimerase